MRRHIVLVMLGVLLAPAWAAAQRPEWEALRSRPIVDVRVEPGEVFDPSKKGQGHFVFQWANWVHIRTRPHVLRREYRQDVGEPFDPLRAAECERNLRAVGVFQDVRVDVQPLGDGVEVILRTTDKWTTEVYPVLRSQGGVNQIGLVLGERNILGLGFEIGGSAIYSNDVNEASLYWKDRRFLGSRWDAIADLRRDDLARGEYFGMSHPFYADDVRWTSSLHASFTDGDTRIFKDGRELIRVPVTEDQYEGWVGLHRKGTLLQRYGVFYTRRHLTGVVTDDISTIGLTASLLRRHFVYRCFVDKMGCDEEYGQGWALQAGVGADLRALGAASDRLFWRCDASYASGKHHGVWLGATLRHQGFSHRSAIENSRFMAEGYGGWQPGNVQTFAFRFGAEAWIRDLPYLQFNLGSDDRLRGYPARELNGTRILFGSLEERLFSSRRVLFMRLGGVLFVDGAAAWNDGQGLSRGRARLGAGFGLRLGTDPAGSNVTRIDLGFGKHSVELSLSSGSFFNASRSIGFPGMSVLH